MAFGAALSLSTRSAVKRIEFLPDTQEIGRRVIIGQTGWETAMENNKLAFTSGSIFT